MSSFSAGTISGALRWDNSQFQSAMTADMAVARAFAAIVRQSIDQPLEQAGQAAGGHGQDIGQGVLRAESMMALFPEVVTSFLADPLLGLVSIARSAFDGVSNAIKSVFAGVMGLSETYDKLGDTSERLGVSVEYLNKLQIAGRGAGITNEGVEKGLRKISENAAEAVDKGGAAEEAFNGMGISTEFLRQNLDNTQAITEKYFEQLGKLPTQAERIAAAHRLMGKSGADLVPLFSQTGGQMDALSERAHSLGATITTANAAAANSFEQLTFDVGDAWTGITRSVTQPIFEIFAAHAEEMLPVIQQVATVIRDALGKAMEFLKPHLEYAVAHIGEAIPVITRMVSLVGDGLAMAWRIVTPLIGAGGTMFGVLIDVATALEGPLKIVAWVLEKIAQALKVVIDLAAAAAHTAAGVVNSFKGLFTGDFSDAQKSFGAAGNSIGQTGQDLSALFGLNQPLQTITQVDPSPSSGTPAAPAAGAAGATVAVNGVTINVDSDKAAGQIAAALTKTIDLGVSDLMDKVSGHSVNAKIRNSFGGAS